MGRISTPEHPPIRLNVFGQEVCLVTAEAEKLREAASYVNQRLSELQRDKPLAKSSDLQILLLLELGMHKIELEERGKGLLKRADELIDSLGKELREH